MDFGSRRQPARLGTAGFHDKPQRVEEGLEVGCREHHGAGLAFVSPGYIRFAPISRLGNEFFLQDPLCRLFLGRSVSAYYGTPLSAAGGAQASLAIH